MGLLVESHPSVYTHNIAVLESGNDLVGIGAVAFQ